MTDLSLLPTPLARMLDVCEREDAVGQPFRAVHRLVDAIEVFAKLHTVAGVCAFSDAVLRADAHPTESIQLRVMLAAGLRTPSLGTWWQFARESARALRSLGVAHPLPGADDAILEKHPMRKAFDGNDNLIAFRNGYAHGATPSDATCVEDLKRVRPRLAELVERASWLRETEWLVRDEKARWWLTRGLTPTLLTNDEVASRAGGVSAAIARVQLFESRSGVRLTPRTSIATSTKIVATTTRLFAWRRPNLESAICRKATAATASHVTAAIDHIHRSKYGDGVPTIRDAAIAPVKTSAPAMPQSASSLRQRLRHAHQAATHNARSAHGIAQPDVLMAELMSVGSVPRTQLPGIERNRDMMRTPVANPVVARGGLRRNP